jgi:hypothetical protein
MSGATTDLWDLAGGERVMRSVELLLSPKQVLSILQDYILFDRPKIGSRAVLQKLIPRYPQVEGRRGGGAGLVQWSITVTAGHR